MDATSSPEVNSVIAQLLSSIRGVLDQKLIGLYLYGSLVWGDFDDQISDIDLLAAISCDLVTHECIVLQHMHATIAQQYSRWNDRIEVGYVSLHGLRTFKTERSPIAVISPGEPFNIKTAGDDWLINWYVVQEHGVTLWGPPPQTLITPITHAEFRQAVRVQAATWRDYVTHARASRPAQGYAILTMCRALRSVVVGDQVSKVQAARWAIDQMPQWAGLIEQALRWRQTAREPVADHTATFAVTQQFVNDVADRIAAWTTSHE